MPWQIRYNDRVYREADLTIDESEAIEKLLDATWWEIAPLRSARHAKVIAAYLVSRGEGRGYDEVVAEIGATKVYQFLESVSHDEEDDLPSEWTDGVPPKAAAPTTAG
jgi:hypothetical protein